MKSLKINIHPYLIILSWTLLFFTVPRQNLYSQVFPQTSSPEEIQRQQVQEKEKLAFQYFSDKEYDKALDLFRDLYHLQPTQHHYYYYFLCLTELHEYDEAEKLVKSRIKTDPTSARYKVDLGYLYILTDKPDKADKTFDDLLDNLRPNKSSVTELANAFLNRRQYDYTIKTYLKGRQLLHNTEMFHQDLARIYELTGNYGAMIDEYLDLLEDDPTQVDLVQNRLQNILNKDIDDKIGEMLRESLLKRNQRNPENRNIGEMLLWLSVQRKDFEFALVQAKSLDTRYNEGGMLVFSVANLCLSNNDYDIAIEAFNYLIKKGPTNPYYTESTTGLLKAKFQKIVNGYDTRQSDLIALKKEYEDAIDKLGRNPRTVLLIRDLAHLEAFYLNDLDESVLLLNEALEIPSADVRTKAQIKLELGDILLFKGQVWDASLLYSQVEKAFKNDPIGHEAKFRNAKLSYYIGEFDWAKAQLDVLKAATSKLIANDAMELSLLISDNMDPDSTYTGLSYYARADLLIYRRQDSLAIKTLDSISTLGLYSSLDDEVLYSKANIYIHEKRYQEADSALAKIVKTYGQDILADNALFKRAELQEGPLDNKAKAMELYEQLMTDYPGSLFVTEARKRYRKLRGDYNN